MKIFRIQLKDDNVKSIISRYKFDGKSVVNSIKKNPCGPYQRKAWQDNTGYEKFDKIMYNDSETLCEDGSIHGYSWCVLGWDSGKEYRAGCMSIEDLVEWFKPVMQLLHDNGFHIVVYETDDYKDHKLSKQCRFNVENATRIESHSILDYVGDSTLKTNATVTNRRSNGWSYNVLNDWGINLTTV